MSIYLAAERMVDEHGTEALATANKEAQIARAEGIEPLAKTWDLICAGIRDLDDSKRWTTCAGDIASAETPAGN